MAKCTIRRRRWVALGSVIAIAAGALAYSVPALTSPLPEADGDLRYVDAQRSPEDRLVGHDPETVLSDALTRTLSDSIAEIAIDAAPPPDAGAKTWLRATVKVDAADERAIRSIWLTELVQGVLADSIGEPVGLTIEGLVPGGGRAETLQQSVTTIARDQDFRDRTDEEILSSITKGLTEAGLTLVEASVMRVGQPAPVVVVETTNAEKTAADAQSLVTNLFGQPVPKYEGYYLEVRGPDGTPLIIQAASFRSGAGHLWFDPSVEDSLSLLHG